MLLNLNVGILGHVDSGKTTLCKALSEISSTAAFDKNPQSQERGITLDLGFSALCCELPNHLKTDSAQSTYDSLQFTFVDCPGHAKLIRTIIGGAQIIDLMILVIDATKGIQTQTAECLVIGELTCKHMIVALNKIDQLESTTPTIKLKSIEKVSKRLRNVINETCFKDAAIVPISALTEENLPEFVEILQKNAFLPARNTEEPFLFAVDHCFFIRGQGTVCTGTVLQGTVKCNDSIEIPALKLIKKVKSIQMFRKPMKMAKQGDRIGICITQFDPTLLERGIISEPNYVPTIKAAIVRLNPIKYYKGVIGSKYKFHISLGHETVMAVITLFSATNVDQEKFDWQLAYEYLPEVVKSNELSSDVVPCTIFALLEFEHTVAVQPNALVIGSKLDMDASANHCRLAFWSHLDSQAAAITANDTNEFLCRLQVFKAKSKCGYVQRVVNAHEVIVDHLFSKESNRHLFIGMSVELQLPTSQAVGIIESTFGSTTKVKVRLSTELTSSDIELLKQKNNNVKVMLNFRKYLYQSGKRKIVQ